MKNQKPLKSQRLIASTLALYGVPATFCNGAIIHNNTSSFTIDLTSASSHEWNVDGDSSDDFQFLVNTSFGGAIGAVSMNSDGVLNGFGWVFNSNTGTNSDINNLSTGFSVGAALSGSFAFGTDANQKQIIARFLNIDAFGANVTGFTEGVEGYAGFRFTNVSGTHYGWASLTFDNVGTGGPNGSITINEWAYNDVAGASIQVGAVPEPAETATAIGLLALGAAGVHRWRKNRVAKAA